MEFTVKFWGVRGTFPCAYPSHLRYGGNTSCLEVRAGGQILVLDAGTGLRALGKRFLREGVRRATMLLTHTHLDHINGFPFFEPGYAPSFGMRILSGPLGGTDCIRNALSKCMDSPLFPVPLATMRADLQFENVEPGDRFDLGPDLRVRTAALNHPGGALGYRIEHAGKVFCYVTDTEPVPGQLDATILDLIQGADMVVYDSTYTEQELESRRGWGHSTWNEGVRLCRAADAKGLALFHHDPDHDDAFMEALEGEARAAWSKAFAAREGAMVDLLAPRP